MEFRDLFLRDSVDKQILIDCEIGQITNKELHSEQFEISESLCSEPELRFGACESSSVKFRISNVYNSLNGMELSISMVLDKKTEMPFVFGKYTVVSDTPTADKSYRDIVAYDKMYDIINSDVAEWYNSLQFPLTMKEFRSSFISYFGLEEVEVNLINDDMIVEKTIETVELSGKTVINSICEINGCFGHINRENKFDYIYLYDISTVYPSNDLYPSDSIFPDDGKEPTGILKSHYIKCVYEDFETKSIDSIMIYEDGDDIGNLLGVGNNTYIIQDNFLIYGKTNEELNDILQNLLSVIKNLMYRPCEITAKGNPTISLGEGIILNTKNKIVYTYVLNRTISGIQNLIDIYTSEGTEKYEKNLNSTVVDLIKLKSRTNKLIRTVEETRSEISNVESGLKTIITQTEKELKVEIEDAKKVATSYLHFDSENGLQVGQATDGKWSGFRTQMIDGFFNVLDESGNVLSSFGAKIIELGKNSVDAVIKFCGGLGKIYYGIRDEYSLITGLNLKSEDVYIVGENTSNLYQSYMEDYTEEGGKIKGGNSFVSARKDSVQIHSEYSGDYEYVNGILMPTDNNYSDAVIDPYSIYAISKRLDLYGTEGIFLNNYQFGENVVLWSGSKKMVSSETINLSFPVSQQAHGIVLVFSYYTDNEAQNYNFFDFFVSKHIIEYATGRGHYFSGVTPGGAISKYLYLGNKSITGADANDVDTASPHNVLNSRYVLRFVIGV